MVQLIEQLNAIRDPSLVERILIANARTYVGEIVATDFKSIESLISAVARMKDDNKPFVVRQAAKNWKVVRRFNNFDSLLEQAKREHETTDRKYTAYKPEADGHLNQSHAAPYGFMSFYNFLTTGKQRGLYLLGVPEKDGRRGASPFEVRKNETTPPIFAADIDTDHAPRTYIDLFKGCLASRRHVFFNSSHSWTNLHYDTDTNMYVCALGRRRWTIAHPAHAPIIGASNGKANYSRLMPTKGINGLHEHRLAHLVKFVSVDLEAGDLLFVPPTWWHVVEGLLDDFSCGINWFFTIPTISTKSRLDTGYEWINSHDKLAISSGMGMSMTVDVGDIQDDFEEEEERPSQPDGADANMVRCSAENFIKLMEQDILNEFGRIPDAFNVLRPVLIRECIDTMISRQLVQIAFNSCKTNIGNLTQFSRLCIEIRDILNRRRGVLESRRSTKRQRRGFN